MSGMRPGRAKAPWVGVNAPPVPPDLDEKVRVSALDTTTDYLASKIVNGFGILPPAILFPAGNEKLRIAVDLAALEAAIEEDFLDEMVAISSADQTTGYLASKLIAGSNVSLTVVNPGLAEELRIDVAVPPDLNDKVRISALDVLNEYLVDKIVAAGTLVATTFDKGGGSFALRLDAPTQAGDHKVFAALTDTTAETLIEKITASGNMTAATYDKGGGNLGVRLDSADKLLPIYSGDPDVDGTWRIRVDGSGNLTFDKRIGGAWSQRGSVVG